MVRDCPPSRKGAVFDQTRYSGYELYGDGSKGQELQLFLASWGGGVQH